MARKRIPIKIKHTLFYNCAFVCVICQSQGIQIHHIDEDSSNNDESNLAPLCTKHHNEAHSTSKITANLTPDFIKMAKNKWINEVKKSRENFSTCHGQSQFRLAIWGYIYHDRLVQFELPATERFKLIFETCKNSELVDQHAIAIFPKGNIVHQGYIHNTVYRQFNNNDAQRIHKLYSEMIDDIVRRSNVIHLEKYWWAKSRIRNLAETRNIIFLNTAFYFLKYKDTIENQQRHVYTKKRKVKIEFYVDTKFMRSDSAMEVSFSGHKSCAALLVIKSIEELEDGFLVLHCTPLALGISFNKFDPTVPIS